MKTIYLNHQLSTQYESEILANHSFQTPNLMLPMMKKQLNPSSEIFISVNHDDEMDEFLKNNIIFETIKSQIDKVDGVVIDQIYTDNYHHLNEKLLKEISLLVGEKHLIVGPKFKNVPTFLQSRMIDLFIEYNVSGIMFDISNNDLSDYSQLQPLAKLKVYAKKRIDIIPLLEDEKQLEAFKKIIPFQIVAVKN